MALPVSCSASDLAKASKCLDCIPSGMREPVLIYLLALIASQPLDAAELTKNAKCFDCIPQGMRLPVIIYLLCTIANDET